MSFGDNIIKAAWAGVYTSLSDSLTTHFISPQSFLGTFLVHHLVKGDGIAAGFVVSMVAETISLHVEAKILSEWDKLESYVLSAKRLTLRFVIYLSVGAAAGFMIAVVTITASTGVAVGITSFVGVHLTSAIHKVIVSVLILIKKRPDFPMIEACKAYRDLCDEQLKEWGDIKQSMDELLKELSCPQSPELDKNLLVLDQITVEIIQQSEFEKSNEYFLDCKVFLNRLEDVLAFSNYPVLPRAKNLSADDVEKIYVKRQKHHDILKKALRSLWKDFNAWRKLNWSLK